MAIDPDDPDFNEPELITPDELAYLMAIALILWATVASITITAFA